LKYVDPLGLNHKDLGPGGAAAPANKPSAVDKTTSQVVRDNTGNNTKYSDCPPKKVDPKDLDKANPWKTWELELQYNIQQQIENQNNLSLGEINKIVEIEILKLQRKYKIAYEMSDLVEAQFNRTMYNTLRPLYELNGNEDTKNKLVKLLNDSLNVAVVTEGSSFKETPKAVEGFKPPETYINSKGQITNGKYIIDEAGMAPHKTGSTTSGKGQFLYGVDAETATLDAAAYADANNLWVGNKAKVPVTNGMIGVTGKTGQLTNYINVYKTNTGFVHASPGNP
jgi:hypothetical protein